MNIGVFLTNFTILLAEMRSEIVGSLASHTKKLISGLVIPAIQFSFPSIPLSLSTCIVKSVDDTLPKFPYLVSLGFFWRVHINSLFD